MKEKRLYLLRHGRVDTGGRYIGATDLPLLPAGRQEIAGIGPFLEVQDIDAILCSPLRRCRQTMELLAFPTPATICDDLREIDFGRWEGLTFAEISHQDSELVACWNEWREDFAFPGGEKMTAFIARIQQVRRLIEDHAARRLLIISHGGVIRQLLCQFLGLAPEKYLLFDIRPGGCAALDLYSEGGVLVGLNLGAELWRG